MRTMTPQTMKEAVQLASGSAIKHALGYAMIEESGGHTGGRFELAEHFGWSPSVLEWTANITMDYLILRSGKRASAVAREPRGAGNEPKRERPRVDGCEP